jgi:hypothetical protein
MFWFQTVGRSCASAGAIDNERSVAALRWRAAGQASADAPVAIQLVFFAAEERARSSRGPGALAGPVVSISIRGSFRHAGVHSEDGRAAPLSQPRP